MGSIVAQDVFQRKLDAIFLSIPGVTGIADDMIIYGRNDQEHDEHSVNFLEVCRKNTLTLNPEKMQFRLPQVSFFGHQWSARGLNPDPKKIEAVKRMELPQDLETMRSFLGLVNYLNWFSPYLAELSDPLRQICRKSEEFQLTGAACVAFSRTRGNFQKCYTSILQCKQFHNSADRCFQEGPRCCTSSKFQTSNVCIKSIDWK